MPRTRLRTRARGGSGGASFTPASLGSDLMAWYDFGDAATVTGSPSVTAVTDKSTNARNLTGTNNPQWDGAKLTTNGTNNYLSRTESFMYANGQVTMCMVVSGASVASRALIAEGSSSTTAPLYALPYTKGTSGDLDGFIRNDASTNLLVGGTGFNAVALNSTKKLVTIVDDGEFITCYVNGVQASVILNYTRSGTLTMNRFCIGGLLRTTFGSGWAGDYYEICIAKNSTYQLELEGYLAHKHGI